MKCNKCMKEIEPGSQFCPYCGEKVQQPETPVLPPISGEIFEEKPNVAEESKKQKGEDLLEKHQNPGCFGP